MSPYVRKVRVLMAEKGLAYNHDQVNPFKPPPDFETISPLKRIPVLRDEGDGANVTIPDSSVICAYLERKHPTPSLYPSAPVDYARALWLEEYASSDFARVGAVTVFQPVVLKRIMRQESDFAAAKEGWEQKVPPFFDYFERELGDRTHFVGDKLSIADIAIASPFVNLAHAGFVPDSGRHPHLSRFVKAMHARPSFAACIEEECKGLSRLGLKYAS